VLVACATAVTAVVGTVLSFVPRGAAWAVVVALLLAGVAWPAARCAQEPPTEPIEKPRGDGRPAVNGRAFVSVMGMPLIGMAIASFTMGVSPAFLFDGTVDAQRLGALVGSAALLGLVPLRGRRPLYTFVYTVYLPVFAAVVMVLAAVPATLVPSDAAVGLAYAFFSMVSCVAVASSNAIANAREFPRSFVIALLVGVFCLAGTAGLSFGGSPNELASDNGSLLLLLMALFGSWILLGGCARAWRLTVNPSTEGPLATGATSGADAPANNAAQEVDPFESRIAQLAKRYGLSPRETQIAGYVGRGHSSVFVAKTLLISESTVYTHTHNIYRKLGIASREEFIQLVTGSSEAATA
jgi:DNA-binding CsgD family transcriptional regulator